DVVDDPDSVAATDLAGPLEQLDQPQPLAVQPDRNAALELDPDHLGLVGGVLRAGDQLEHVVLGRVAELLDPTALAGAAPDVVVDRVGHGLGPPLYRDPVLPRVA